ncbi:acyltransferase [Arthrobacter sp. AK04]|uniref:acyltransferase family protein n=1 Tax=Arthrobacter sp. AK04 TaxID=2900048 RepID=UPI001E627FEA|nr:acyltransferase [Arthrobacter sp. AK04]MCD5341613.1 acyltransferase [Arthrobacter sp. AK04]
MGKIANGPSTHRYTSLDGLRGLAALVVLIHHCFLVSPLLTSAVNGSGDGPMHPWVWWATFTPLHLFWAGGEAVYVFFILSGFVLALPFIGNENPNWGSYFPRRIIRIYLPVWASLIFALGAAWVFPRISGPNFSPWINQHDEAPDVLSDAILLWGAGSLNSPLWSLQWEMNFSLLLPLYVIIALRFQRVWLLGLSGLFLLIAAGEILHISALVCLPMFGVGVLMAVRRDLITSFSAKVSRSGWAVVLILSTALLCSRWIFPQMPVGAATAAIGGALLLFAFIECKAAIRMGTFPTVRWLGSRSFSLYLVHEPIVVSVAFCLEETNPFTIAALSVPLTLLVTEVFFRSVEKPSQRLARAAGNRFTGRGFTKSFSDHVGTHPTSQT